MILHRFFHLLEETSKLLGFTGKDFFNFGVIDEKSVLHRVEKVMGLPIIGLILLPRLKFFNFFLKIGYDLAEIIYKFTFGIVRRTPVK